MGRNLNEYKKVTLSSYRIAIDHTTQTIGRRTKYYRNLIIVVTVVGLGSIIWAGITWSWPPLAGILLFVPLCGFYFFIDEKLLIRWQQELFSHWEKGELDFRALYEAIISVKTLPKNTIESMLETLPADKELVEEQGVSPSTRQAIASVVTAIHSCRSDSIALKTAGYSIAGGALIAAVLFWIWEPVLGLFLVFLIFFLQRWIRAQRLKSAKEIVINTRQESDFNLEKFLEIVNQANWSPLSSAEREEFLKTLTDVT